MLFLHETLSGLGLKRKDLVRTELLAEETIAQLSKHAPEGASLTVRLRRLFGKVSLDLRMKGEAFDISSNETVMGINAEHEESVDAIRMLVLKAFGENFKYSNRKGVNCVRINTEKASRALFVTLIAIALGLLFGLGVRFLFPAPAAAAVTGYLLQPVRTMFMNALKLVIAPVVFFSVVTSFSQYKNLSEFGRLGAKVMGMYLLTTVIAVSLSIGLSLLVQPGPFGFALSGSFASDVAIPDMNPDVSLISMLVDVIPSNLISPFLESNTLQLIFLAAITGVALGRIGDYATILTDLFESLNSLFLTITTIITSLIPLVVFCTLALTVIETDFDAFLAVLGISGFQIGVILCMMAVYGLLILILARLNPLTFFRKAREGMITSFTLCSSSAAMPTNLRICTEKLGISPKVCNFSIPLGTTVNMDGASIFLVVFSLFMARAYGITLQPAQLLSLAVTVILLSLSAPGVPLAAFICLGVSLRVIGVPVDALGMIVSIAPILDMFDTMSNTTGDVAASLIVAKSEGLLNEERYASKEFE